MPSSLGIMVSSTFYDLRQVRADLSDFLENQLGAKPLLAELSTFPIEPDRDAIENCRHTVARDADVLVLVIGARYGSIDSRADKSITNLEYLAAKAKGIPIYVFVEKEVLTALKLWEHNKSADFSRFVDTPRLFEFIHEVRNEHKVWVFPFERAQEIVAALRSQLAVLFKRGLDDRAKLRGLDWLGAVEKLSAEAYRIALEKPVAWEYRLFLQCWEDENGRHSDLYRRYKSGTSLGISEYVAGTNATTWFGTRLHEISNLARSVETLVNECASAAFGPPGQPGEVESILWTARELGLAFKTALEWCITVRRAHIESPFEPAATELSGFADGVISQLVEFPKVGLDRLSAALQIASLESPQQVILSLNLASPNNEKFLTSFKTAHAEYVRRT